MIKLRKLELSVTKKIVFNMILAICLLITDELYAAFFDNHAEGWHWYIDPSRSEATKEEKRLPLLKATPTEQLKAYQQKLEDLLHKAIMQPSHKNVKRYQLMQKDLMDRSQQFSDVWMQVVYQNPELDHTVKFPVNQKARHIYLDQRQEQIKNTIYKLRNQYGLFFFFSSKCSYCHQFAPIVVRFAKQYDWRVIPISLDHQGIAEFREFMPDNGLAEKWNVTALPSLFAVDPKTGHILPVAFGLTSIDQMETRIMALLPEESHD